MDNTAIEDVVRLLLGLIILLAGRNVFWLCIGAIGFLLGVDLASLWLVDQAAWVVVGIGIAAGLIGALLAVVLERVGFALAGLYAAVFLTIAFAGRLGLERILPAMVVVTGVVGAILGALLTDWAIIIFSALVGAAVISSIFVMTPAAQYAGLVALATLGVIVQRSMLARSHSRQGGHSRHGAT
jgi:hypothetical protein